MTLLFRIGNESLTRSQAAVDTVVAFFLHDLRPVWPVFVFLTLFAFVGAGIEVALMAFVGRLVDGLIHRLSYAGLVGVVTQASAASALRSRRIVSSRPA